jgi:hypothetical protein
MELQKMLASRVRWHIVFTLVGLRFLFCPLAACQWWQVSSSRIKRSDAEKEEAAAENNPITHHKAPFQRRDGAESDQDGCQIVDYNYCLPRVSIYFYYCMVICKVLYITHNNVLDSGTLFAVDKRESLAISVGCLRPSPVTPVKAFGDFKNF